MEDTHIGYYTDPNMDGRKPTDMSHAALNRANLSGTRLTGVNLSDADLTRVNLREAKIKDTDFTDADLTHVTLIEANLSGSTFTRAKLVNANLSDVRGSIDTTDSSHDNRFSKANLLSADLSGAYLQGSDFTDANLSAVDLSGGNVEGSNLTRTNLSGANLTDCRTHGAIFTDAHINDTTILGSNPDSDDETKWWQYWKPNQSSRCIYDPESASQIENSVTDIGKAADTYRTYEKLARQNSRPEVQSSMFTLRQDMQLIRHTNDFNISRMHFFRINRLVFKYGESIWRTLGTGVISILAFGFLYWWLGLIEDSSGAVVGSLADAIYFSTMTFTTLGMGDFHPDPTSGIARGLVTLQAWSGAILIALFVYVLGRRSTR